MYKIYFKVLLIIISFFISGFKKQIYNTVEKEIDGRKFYFNIPNSFCEYNNNKEEAIEFVKCYEKDLKKEGELSYFSEKIVIFFDKNDKKIQNITDNYFANIQKKNYNKISPKDKERYNYDINYPLKNQIKNIIIDDLYIHNRIGYSENHNKYIIYDSKLFLNKKYFNIVWAQYLTKNEKLLTKKNFIDFIKQNKKINSNNNLLYYFPNNKLIITAPKFKNFLNYTDISDYNNGKFNAIFVSLLKNEKLENTMKFRISFILSNTTIKEDLNLLKKNNNNFTSNVKLIKYKKIDFIKTITGDSIIYISYINISHNITILVSLETSKKSNTFGNKDIKYLYNYRKQLIEDNL